MSHYHNDRGPPPAVNKILRYMFGICDLTRLLQLASPRSRKWFKRSFTPGAASIRLLLVKSQDEGMHVMTSDYHVRGTVLSRLLVDVDRPNVQTPDCRLLLRNNGHYQPTFKHI
jgi:hypothetical protein